jgi:hypothetical protein
VELAYRACYEKLHPELKSGTRPPENQAYVVGEKGRSLDKYMRLFHDPNLKTVKASIPDIYLRNGMRFRASGILFKDNAFEFNSIKMRDYRRCDTCSGGFVEDEPHVVFDCPFYDDLRSGIYTYVSPRIALLSSLDSLYNSSYCVSAHGRVTSDYPPGDY